MFPNQRASPNNEDPIMKSLGPVATVLAATASFLLTPWLYGRSINWIQVYTARNYGTGFEDLIGFCWFCVCGFLIYAIARAKFVLLLTVGGGAIITRLAF